MFISLRIRFISLLEFLNLEKSFRDCGLTKKGLLNLKSRSGIIGETRSGKSSLLKSLLVGTKLTGDVCKTGSLINLFIPTQIKIKTGMAVQLNLFF